MAWLRVSPGRQNHRRSVLVQRRDALTGWASCIRPDVDRGGGLNLNSGKARIGWHSYLIAPAMLLVCLSIAHGKASSIEAASMDETPMVTQLSIQKFDSVKEVRSEEEHTSELQSLRH